MITTTQLVIQYFPWLRSSLVPLGSQSPGASAPLCSKVHLHRHQYVVSQDYYNHGDIAWKFSIAQQFKRTKLFLRPGAFNLILCGASCAIGKTGEVNIVFVQMRMAYLWIIGGVWAMKIKTVGGINVPV